MDYSAKVMDHFLNPRNVESIENSDGIGEVGNAKCGDLIKIFLKIEGDRIANVKFQTFGCVAAIALSSMVTKLIKGRTLEEVWNLSNKEVAEALNGLPPTKMHCSMLTEEAVHEAINNYLRKTGLESWIE